MKRLFFTLVAAAFLPTAFAEPIDSSRFKDLPATELAPWQTYVDQSTASAAADQAVIDAEVAANKMPAALRAPNGGDFKLSAKAGDPWYAGEDAKKLADAILSYQTASGGWSKHLGFSEGVRKPGMQWTSQNEPGQRAHYVATFDNASTTSEMDYLANVWLATKREDCKAGFIKGLNFILAAQYPNGGWPQVYPLEGGYHDDVTYNDDAVTRILELLDGIARKEPAYAFLDEAQRAQAAGALANGVRCILATQVVVDGKKTVWCAQYDPLTLKPSNARKMEPATLSGLESARILKFLMTFEAPDPEVVACIESGLKWFDSAKIAGATKPGTDQKADAEPNAASTEIRWARFYDLNTGKPVFPGRDGILYDTFEAMAAKNKVGYDYYTTQPASIVKNGQNKWRKMLASKTVK